MENQKDMNVAIEIAKKYGIGKLYIFGSALTQKASNIHDYDFAVDEIPSGVFFRFCGTLLGLLSKPIDVVNLSGTQNKFKTIVKKEARLIYDRSKA